MYELAGEAAAMLLRAAGASPALTGAVARLTPKLIAFAKNAIDRGADPDAEYDLMMSAAEEAGRAAERAKFGA